MKRYLGPAIELRNLSRSFGSLQAVADVSFSVPQGNVFGYIGPNGAGKTTSMRILATLEIPDLGDAFIDGFSSVNDPDKVRRRLGFMPDSFGIYRNTNCAEYLDFYARSHGLIGRDRTARLRKVMDFTGLKSLADRPIRGLSKGMRQRLCLGRALIHDPAVLLLDEPAAGLDPRARIELRTMIRTLASDGKTILISSHILTELGEMCDRVGIIEQGRLLAQGTVQDICRSTGVRRMHLEISGQTQHAIAILKAAPEIQSVTAEGSEIHVALRGDAESQADVLTQLILGGVRVIQCRNEVDSLENVFLEITQGRVQ